MYAACQAAVLSVSEPSSLNVETAIENLKDIHHQVLIKLWQN